MKKTKKINSANDATEQETNLVHKVTLEILNKRHNALARYLGIPCIVPVTVVFKGAVMTDATVMHSEEYACYRIDLAPFKGEFDKIRFRATTDAADIALGMLVDMDDNLESLAKNDNTGEATVVMPLSAKSKTLFATMPLKNGKPAWKNLTVELLTNGGVIDNFNDALNTLLGKIQALEARFQELLPSCEPEAKIALG